MITKLSIVIIIVKISLENVHSIDLEKPAFCRTYDCPKYITKCEKSNVEVRNYPQTNWAKSTGNGFVYDFIIAKVFMNLFRYINGANEQGVKIPMTVPVVVEKVRTNDVLMSTYNVYFYIKDDNPPKPNNTKVEMTTFPESVYFVFKSPGYLGANAIESMHNDSMLKLSEAGIRNVSNEFYFAGYNSPTEFRNRHNEIWIQASNENVQTFCQN